MMRAALRVDTVGRNLVEPINLSHQWAESFATGRQLAAISGRKVERGRTHRRRREQMKAYLELDETEKLEVAATCVRDKLLIRLLARLGCRVSEALALTPDDIDFEQGTVRIEHLKSRIRLICTNCNARLGKSHVFCPKCGKAVDKRVTEEKHRRRMRTLPIDRKTLDLLREYVNRGGAITRGGKRLIFGINRHRAWQIVKQCAERAGLPRLVNPETGREHGVSPHRLRDAFAVHAMRIDDSGDGLRFLQEQLGHASFNTTARYRKVAGGELKEWYESLWRKGVKTRWNLDQNVGAF